MNLDLKKPDVEVPKKKGASSSAVNDRSPAAGVKPKKKKVVKH